MIPNTFMNLARARATEKNVNIKGVISKDYTIAKNYSYIQCITHDGGEVVAGDFVVVKPICTVDPRRCKLMIVPNAKLSQVASVSYQSILEAGDGPALRFSLKVEKDCDLSKLDWICRIYAIYD